MVGARDHVDPKGRSPVDIPGTQLLERAGRQRDRKDRATRIGEVDLKDLRHRIDRRCRLDARMEFEHVRTRILEREPRQTRVVARMVDRTIRRARGRAGVTIDAISVVALLPWLLDAVAAQERLAVKRIRVNRLRWCTAARRIAAIPDRNGPVTAERVALSTVRIAHLTRLDVRPECLNAGTRRQN